MTSDPMRLLDQVGLSAEERMLLEAGRSQMPVDYDVGAGLVRFRAGVTALTVAAVATTAASTAKGASGGSARRALFGKLGVKLFIAVALPVAGAAAALHFGRAPESRKASDERSATAPVVRQARAENAPVNSAMGAAPTAVLNGGDSNRVAPDVAGANNGPSAPAPATSIAPEARVAPASRGGARNGASSTGTGGPSTTEVAAARVHLDEDTTEGAQEAPSRDAPSAPALNAARAPTPPSTAAQGEPKTKPSTVQAPRPELESPPARSGAVEEMQAIAKARDLLTRDPNGALRVLSDLGREHPNGYFVEERRALTVLALVRAGNATVAHDRAVAFVRDYPNGPFTDRVRAAAGL